MMHVSKTKAFFCRLSLLLGHLEWLWVRHCNLSYVWKIILMWRLFSEAAEQELENRETWKKMCLNSLNYSQICVRFHSNHFLLHSVPVPGTSVLTALIQTYFWSIINNLARVNKWIQVLVTASSKFKDIESILCFNGTPQLPIHSISPKIIISLVRNYLNYVLAMGLLSVCLLLKLLNPASGNGTGRIRATCSHSSVL